MASVRQIREAMHAAPFHPFTVHLVDGRNYFVRHPNLVAIPTTDRGRDFTTHDDDGPHHVDLALVVEIHPVPHGAPAPGNGP